MLVDKIDRIVDDDQRKVNDVTFERERFPVMRMYQRFVLEYAVG